MLSSRTEAKNLIGEILLNFNKKNLNEIPNNCNGLIKHLFSNQYLLFTDFNYYLESNGIISILVTVLDKVHEQFKRDILRLIHLLLQINKSLRNEVKKSSIFQTFLFKYFDRNDFWENRVRFKHHINIASRLLVDKDVTDIPFNTESIRRNVRSFLSDLILKKEIENDDAMPCIIFYACSMCKSEFEKVPIVPDDEIISTNIFIKENKGKTLDLLRDYIDDFKKFYECENEPEKKSFVLFKPKSEYSFQQVCNTLLYYSLQSEKVRMDLLQAGLYATMNRFLSIKNIPEELLQYSFDILKLLPLDNTVFIKVQHDCVQPIGEKLKVILTKRNISEETKKNVQDLLKLYNITWEKSIDTSSCEDTSKEHLEPNNLISFSGNSDKKIKENSDTHVKVDFSTFYGFENWDYFQVQEWFEKNNLSAIKETFSHLTGNGLEQFQILSKKCDKMSFVIFLMEKVKIPFDITLELISALEKL